MECECGAKLLGAIGVETIRTTEGESLTFRRQNDYVVCPNCHKAYSILQLRGEDSLERLEAEAVGDVTTIFAELDYDAASRLEVQDPEPLPLEDRFE